MCEDSYSAMHETSKPFRQIAGQSTHCISCLCLYVGVRPLIPCSVSVGAQVKPGGEYDGVNPLLDDLPTELPVKDALPLQRQGLNPEDKGSMPIDEDSLEGLPWEFIINKDARQEWARMDRPFRSASVQFNTQQIAFCYTSHCMATISHKECEVKIFCLIFSNIVAVCLVQGEGDQGATAHRSGSVGGGWQHRAAVG